MLSKRQKATRTDNFRADLNELLSQARERPILDRFGRRERPHQEIAEAVNLGMKLMACRVGAEQATEDGPRQAAKPKESLLAPRAVSV